jgi:hypothetical protein
MLPPTQGRRWGPVFSIGAPEDACTASHRLGDFRRTRTGTEADWFEIALAQFRAIVGLPPGWDSNNEWETGSRSLEVEVVSENRAVYLFQDFDTSTLGSSKKESWNLRDRSPRLQATSGVLKNLAGQPHRYCHPSGPSAQSHSVEQCRPSRCSWPGTATIITIP